LVCIFFNGFDDKLAFIIKNYYFFKITPDILARRRILNFGPLKCIEKEKRLVWIVYVIKKSSYQTAIVYFKSLYVRTSKYKRTA
jgi:hypothetical protein